MGNPAVANILKSNAVTWIAPEGEAFPDETTVAAGAAWGGNWERIGFTKEPLKLAYEDEEADWNVEENIMAVGRVKISEEAALETVLAELTGEYLQYALDGTLTVTAAGASQKGYEQLLAGGVTLKAVYTIGFEGIRYNASAIALPLRMGFYRATLRLNGELEFSKRSDETTGVPLQARALGREDGSSPIWFQRVTAPATS
jgi:hypothetical protein